MKFLLIIVSFMLTACANSYSDFYKSNTNESYISTLEILKDGNKPILIKTDDIENSLNIYMSKGFDIIGQSFFNGEMHTEDQLILVATQVKSTHVLYGAKFVTTQATSTPLILPNGFGGFNAAAINRQSLRYEQGAVFLAKMKELPRFGGVFDDLTPDQRRKFGRNTGVVIKIVVEKTAAFNANLLVGDLIIELNGRSIANIEELSKIFNSIESNANGFNIKLIRDSKIKDIDLIFVKK